MSGSHKFKTTVTAVNAFYPVCTQTGTQSHSVPAAAVPKKRKKTQGNINQPVILEMIKNISIDYDSPYQLAANGHLDELKSFIEIYGTTLKECDENKATFLHHAASTNQIATMQYLIESGVNLAATDKHGHTALHVAVLQGHVEAVHLLLSSGINDSILNSDQDAALHIAARTNNTDLVAAFLEHPDIDFLVTGYRKRTVLHIIAEHDNLEVARVVHNCLMMKNNPEKYPSFRMCAQDEDELTPVHLAARKGSHRVLDMYMSNCKSHGYPPEVVLGFIDEENSTPLHAAIDGGYTKVVEVLLKHGANPTVQKGSQVPPFLVACSQGKLEMIKIMINYNSMEIVPCTDIYGQTCLHRCAQAINSNQVISYLAENGAQIDATDNKGQTPLMMSIIAGSASGVTTLLGRGANVLIKDVEGNNALHHAVKRNRKKILHILLELPQASDLVVASNNEGKSPIHSALNLGLSGLVNPMMSTIKHKLKNIKDHDGNNYLHLAASSGEWKPLSILLEIPECLKLLNETNKHGGTPLHHAAYVGNQRCVEMLLSHGAMVHKCYTGKTPFMVACSQGHAEVAHTLFEAHPFQLEWKDDKGQNSLHMGAGSGNPQVITLLLDIGVPIIHDFSQKSFFDELIEQNHVKCALAVIEHERYEECLDLVSPFLPHPMVSLIIHMPEVARKVLERSHTTADLARTNPKYWERFDFKYLSLKNLRCDLVEDQADEKKEEKNPLMSEEMMTSPVQYKGSIKQPQGTSYNKSRTPQRIAHLETLRTMVKYNRSRLLTNSVTNAYLKVKWRSYGKWIYAIIVSLVLLQALFFFIFTALVPRPTDIVSFTKSQTNGTAAVCGDGTNSTVICPEFSRPANICRFITLGFAVLNFIVWIVIVLQIRQEALNLIRNSYILIDLLSFVFTVYYLIPSKGLNNANWEAGAIAAFFTWFSLILKFQLFDVFGVYITMFLAITRTVLQVLFVVLLFIIAFGLSLYILTGNLKSYSNIGYSMFINFGHLLGELDYGAFVEDNVNGELHFDWLTFIFVIILAILMGIVVMNLLIGLAIDDIDAIRSNAIAEKKVVEVTYFSHIDIALPSRILQKLDRHYFITYPNKNVFFLRKVWRFFWQSVKGQDPYLNDDDDFTSSDIGADQRGKDISKIQKRVDELTLNQERIISSLSQIREMQESMMKMVMQSNNMEEQEDKNTPNNE